MRERSMSTSNERLAYIELALIPGIGPTRLAKLSSFFGSWSDALEAPIHHLRAVPQISLAAATAIIERDRGRLLRVVDQLTDLGGFLLTPLDTDFPETLRRVLPPP